MILNFLQIILPGYKTRTQIVYVVLFASLLLNLVIFILLSLHESRSHQNTIPPSQKPIENVIIPRVDRSFKSLDERLKKYKILKGDDDDEIRINVVKPKSFQTFPKPEKKKSSTKKVDMKFSTRKVDLKEAQKLADERRIRSQHYIKQIFKNNNSSLKHNFTNENSRSRYLVVAKRSKNLQIYLHTPSPPTSFNDGIVQQLHFVPDSYKRKLKKLNLMDRFSRGFNDDSSMKLYKHLKENFDMNFETQKNSSVGTDKERSLLPRKVGPNWKSLLKIIYVADGLSEGMSYGRKVFQTEKCLVSSCYITSRAPFKSTAHLRIEKMFASETFKPPGQIWLNWFLESPINSVYLPKNTYGDRINWTASFRSDSTIVTPYAKYLPHDPSRPIVSKRKKDYSKGKTHLAAWFVSICATTNNRFEYVKNLQKHISVDIYGACGPFTCAKNMEKTCFKMLSNKYKFYLSFENSNCDNYITEKFFLNALKNNVVPVVMGARKSDYANVAPPNSFIHVEDFRDEKELAAFLHYLDNNNTAYNKYFEWKDQGTFINTKFWCRLCSLLQDDDKPSLWYSSFEDWWMGEGTCRSGRWDARQAIKT